MKGIERRTFLKSALAAGVAVAAGASLAGCANQPQASQPSSQNESAGIDAVTQRLLDRGIVGANLPDATPIAPLAEPQAWNDEADAVIVGMGGGGLMAAGFLSEKGLSVIGLDKEATVGGASRHATSFCNLLGGSQGQAEVGFPGLYPDTASAIRGAQGTCNFSCDEKLLKTVIDGRLEAYEWFFAQEGINFVGFGPAYVDADVASGKQNHYKGMNNAINALEQVCMKKGTDIRVSTEVIGLVKGQDRILGVKVKGSSGDEYYIKANKGIILSAGGFGMNKDLVKAYIPGAWEACCQRGPMPMHTGEIFRMGLGAGADFSGFNSWAGWAGGIDESLMGGDGQWWHFFFHGERQLFQNPWMAIDKAGNRVPYFGALLPEYTAEMAGMTNEHGDMPTLVAWGAVPGHRAYNICDSKFPTEVFEKTEGDPTVIFDMNRKPLGGLYANWSTMGGLNGEGQHLDLWNGGVFFGGIASTVVTGFEALLLSEKGDILRKILVEQCKPLLPAEASTYFTQRLLAQEVEISGDSIGFPR